MPLYTYHCPACEHEQVESRRIEQRDVEPLCEVCDAPMKRALDTPMVGGLVGNWNLRNLRDTQRDG